MTKPERLVTGSVDDKKSRESESLWFEVPHHFCLFTNSSGRHFSGADLLGDAPSLWILDICVSDFIQNFSFPNINMT